ncbi:hypothetical protein ABZ897_37455 [Nonomuraea sp. NPDC046802]|uniref:hypothetical protein n=1 Tax=Nonomuraea sp. NPDC046802 TaxID=3154919 RepID=UPI0033DAA1DF
MYVTENVHAAIVAADAQTSKAGAHGSERLSADGIGTSYRLYDVDHAMATMPPKYWKILGLLVRSRHE